MNQTHNITKTRAEELLRFLPLFSDTKRKFVTQWDGAKQVPYPDDIKEFFRLAAQEWWTEKDYVNQFGGKRCDDKTIAHADIETIRTMFTFCVRGEYFQDGFWNTVLADGTVQKILKRLQELVPTLPE